ncbi:MAG TPA: alpha/beta hydrolase-fold protein [Ohtaekwangia sp.]|nr:alpha/beta hydrolase-fold protein [Ohtaekwangia sp.]
MSRAKKITFLLFLLTGSVPLTAQQTESIYKAGPDSSPQAGVPKGTLTRYVWESKIYGGIFREYYVYVPAQYNAATPAALMVFQDGYAYARDDGDFRVPIVFDNLIHQQQMPVTIGLFINPGHNSATLPENAFRGSNRMAEYDEMSDRYVTFLTRELIPELEKKYNLANDPRMRAIAGLSSGGICAFTAAWHRPDYFHKVLSHIGSFTNIRGGDAYPSLIRGSTRKDIRVFLQDGADDLDNQYGNWYLANLQMEDALKYKGYDHKFVGGTEGHNGKHGGAILPESLKWLWRDVPVK